MHNIIKTPNYLLIIDDSKIELGNWHTCTYPEYPLEARFTDESTKYDICKGCKNIVAHLPLNNAPTLEGIDLLPPLEDDVDLIYENTEDSFYKKYDDALHYYSFIESYNKAKEKYKYTEEDMRKVCIMYAQWVTGGTPSLRIAQNPDERFEQIIQSLQQLKMPIGFECEIEYIGFQDEGDLEVPKSFINSQGLTQWVGKYIY
jgi:hypothetical protein